MCSSSGVWAEQLRRRPCIIEFVHGSKISKKKRSFCCCTRWIVPTSSAGTRAQCRTLDIVPQYWYSTAFWTLALLHGHLGVNARFCSMCGGNPRPSEGPGTQTGFAGAVAVTAAAVGSSANAGRVDAGGTTSSAVHSMPDGGVPQGARAVGATGP